VALSGKRLGTPDLDKHNTCKQKEEERRRRGGGISRATKAGGQPTRQEAGPMKQAARAVPRCSNQGQDDGQDS